MAFKFFNMATYVRNIIEPIIKSERIMANSEMKLALKTIRAEFDAYKKETNAKIAALEAKLPK